MREMYLLRGGHQAEAFRARYRQFIDKNYGRILEWFLKLPLYEWVPARFPEDKMEACIGTLCLLFLDGKINLCVSPGVTHLQRFANSDKEYEEYITKHFNKQPEKL